MSVAKKQRSKPEKPNCTIARTGRGRFVITVVKSSPSRRVVKPCWGDHGLTSAGAKIADDLIDEWVRLIGKTPREMLASILREACFRVYDLPKKTRAYQEKYRRDNGIGKKKR